MAGAPADRVAFVGSFSAGISRRDRPAQQGERVSGRPHRAPALRTTLGCNRASAATRSLSGLIWGRAAVCIRRRAPGMRRAAGLWREARGPRSPRRKSSEAVQRSCTPNLLLVNASECNRSDVPHTRRFHHGVPTPPIGLSPCAAETNPCRDLLADLVAVSCPSPCCCSLPRAPRCSAHA